MSYNKFGIGIAAPQDNLHVLGAIRFGDSSSSSNQSRIYAGSTWIGWQTNAGTDAMIIRQSNGNVGIGTTDPGSNKLEVAGGTTKLQNLVFNSNEINSQAVGLYLNHTGAVGNIIMAGNGGRVGIGTSPSVDLDVYDATVVPQANSSILMRVDGNKSLWDNNTYLGLQLGSSVWQWQMGTTRNSSTSEWDLRFYSNEGTSRLSIGGNGNVGIGTTNPILAMLHVNGTSPAAGSTSGLYYYFNQTGGLFSSSTPIGSSSMSIYASNNIWSAGSFIASSDMRIKEDISEIDDGDALSRLRALKPSTYKYVDKVSRTSEPVYGFIAQEVKEVLPHAVSLQKSVIPNVMKEASVNSSDVVLMKDDAPHGFIVGDNVRLITESGKESMYEVKNVLNSSSFTVDGLYNAEDSGHRVFVYGKEVDDFHTLDKNAIFTVGVAATQELDRKVARLDSELSELKELLRSKNIM